MSKEDQKRAEMKERMRAQAQSAQSETEQRLARIQTAALPDGTVLSIPTKRIDVDTIGRRASDLRPLNIEHVRHLAKSFAYVGMIQFPVVDPSNVLIAGEHRREAVALLKECRSLPVEELRVIFTLDGVEPSDDDIALIQRAYDKHFAQGVIVHVMDTTGLEADDIRARIEFIENDVRRDFTPDEIRGYIEKLKEAGYRTSIGRPAAGEKVLSRELGIVLHKSRATVFRILKDLENPPPEKHQQSARALELARKATDQFGAKVKVKERDDTTGTVVIEYTSTRQRADIMRALGVDI